MLLYVLISVTSFAFAEPEINIKSVSDITSKDSSDGNRNNTKIDEEVEKNLRLLLKEVSPPAGRFNEESVKAELIKVAQKAVQAFAYYDAEIEIDDMLVLPSNSLSYTLRIALGNKARVQRIILLNDLAQIDQSVFPPQIQALIDQIQTLKGAPLVHQRYESLKNQLQTFALLYGYFDFVFPLHKILVQPHQADSDSGASETSAITIHWIFYFGQRYQFGELEFLQDTRGQDIARNVQSFKAGDYFEQGKLGSFSIDMQSTDYFSSAIARANAQNAVDYKVPVEVILEPKPKDTFEFGVGVSTDTGPRFTVDWARPWVNLRGHSVGSRIYISEPEQSAQLSYRVPKANPLNDFLQFQAGYLLVDNNQTNSETITLSMQRQWGAVKEDEWDKIAFVKFEQESFTQGLSDKVTTRLLLPGLTVRRTRKRGDIFVDWGDSQQLTVEGGSKELVSDIDFFKVLFRTKWIRQWGKHRLIVRTDLGAIATNDFNAVPASQRFFAGGDQSIRGFGLDDVSAFETVGDEDELLGGQYLAVGSIEYAYPVAEKFRVATFFDSGNANDDPFEKPAIGYGIGMHWLSPIGTVRLYLARGESERKNAYNFHIVIGPGV